MEEQSLVTLLLGGGGLGALWAMVRWYLKERLTQEIEERQWKQQMQQRRDELRMMKLQYEQEAMKEVFTRFGHLSDRMAELILELALERDTEPGGDRDAE